MTTESVLFAGNKAKRRAYIIHPLGKWSLRRDVICCLTWEF